MKNIFSQDRKNISFNSVCIVIFVVVLTSFLATQLIINAKMTPLGTKLQSLNNEKNMLIEENRSFEQDLAAIKSLTAVEHMTQKSLKLSTAKESQIRYIVDTDIRAER